MMKRYLAFPYDRYYPTGAARDFAGDFDTLDAVIAEVPSDTNYLDVLDLTTGKWITIEHAEMWDNGPWVLKPEAGDKIENALRAAFPRGSVP